MKVKSISFILLIVFSLLYIFGCTANENVISTEAPVSTVETAPAETAPALSTPDESGAIVSLIPDYNSNSAAQGGSVDSNGVTLPYAVEGTDLVITAMGGYTGRFVEDNSDAEVKGVFALVVINKGDSAVKMAKIAMEDNDGHQYTFKLSTLPVGKSLLVMESGKQLYSPNIKLSGISGSSSTLENLSLNEDKVKVSFDGQKLNVKNISDEDFTSVSVRFKTFTTGNVYLGGITYSVTFNDLKKGEESSSVPAHFFAEQTEILTVDIRR